MKKYILLSTALLIVALVSIGITDDRRLTFDGFDNLTDLAAAPADGDFLAVMDESADNVVKAGMDDLGLDHLTGITPGTATASKALVLDGSKGIATITTATITTLTSTTANVTTVNATNIDAGASGTAGTYDVFPTTASKGKLTLQAADNSGDTQNIITNASQAGARTWTIPDSGASDSFVMALGTETDYEKFIGPKDLVIATVGTWTITRTAQALTALLHTDADDTSILQFDITQEMRVAAGKGYQLNTMDVIFENATADLDAHSATLDRVVYVDETTEAVTSMPITGTLAVGQNADPQVDVLTVTTPAFEVTTLSKVVLEITVDAATTSVYKLHGIVLKFTRESH